jgi:hypothetical protein
VKKAREARRQHRLPILCGGLRGALETDRERSFMTHQPSL